MDCITNMELKAMNDHSTFNQAIFILPDDEKMTVPFVGELKLHDDKPKTKIVAVWVVGDKE